MSENAQFEPRIVAYVCNWCTYLGADLAGTNRLEYPSNVRLIRLPCTGRIDFNLIIKAFEKGADAILVSGCHPGDCHYTAGNYHARRRWILFRELLNTLGFDLERIHFSWISAAEGRKWQQTITEITEKTRRLGPYKDLYAKSGNGRAVITEPESIPQAESPAPRDGEEELRRTARKLLEEGSVQVVIGFGERAPVFITKASDVDALVWNSRCRSNLAAYLKKKEVRDLGKPAVVVKGCDERSLVVLEKENQLVHEGYHAVGMACEGMGEAKCEACEVRTPRFAHTVIGQAAAHTPAPGAGVVQLAELLAKPPAERMAYWAAEFDRCVKCYACRQVCPLCYCNQCVVEKNRPTVIDSSATAKGNFAWHITRAFHLAGRCVGCGACARACPAGIDLGLLNMSLAQAARENFGFRAGMDPQADPVIGAFSTADKEDFIL